jgi:hypothetical protein
MRLGQNCSAIFRFEVVGEGNAFALFLSFSHGFELAASLGDQLVFVNDGGGLIFCWRV